MKKEHTTQITPENVKNGLLILSGRMELLKVHFISEWLLSDCFDCLERCAENNEWKKSEEVKLFREQMQFTINAVLEVCNKQYYADILAMNKMLAIVSKFGGSHDEEI